MTKLPAQKPNQTVGERAGDATRVRSHPSFALIHAARVSGGAFLFGTPIKHNGFIEVTVDYAYEEYSLHRSWYGPKDHVLTLRMSEAQWASFVSTLNVGSGVPCTITHARRGPVERLAELEQVETWVAARQHDIKQTVERDMAKLRDVQARIERLRKKPGGASKKDFEELETLMTQAVENAPSNYKFLAESLSEHTENLVTEAKSEITAFATRVAMGNQQIEKSVDVEAIEDKSTKRVRIKEE
jgi:hypothetical protein